MKRIIAAIAALLVFASCNGQTNKTDKQNNTSIMSKAIVIFFSHAGDNYSVGNIEVGNTKIVADYISQITSAAQFEIVTHKYDGMAYTPLIELAKAEAQKGELPPYEGATPDLSAYDTVFIGGPVWWGTYPQVMFTLFKDINLDGKTVIPFTTHEGSGLARCQRPTSPKASTSTATKSAMARPRSRNGSKVWATESGRQAETAVCYLPIATTNSAQDSDKKAPLAVQREGLFG